MATRLDRPCANLNFRVDLGGRGDARALGFAEVILPELRLDGDADITHVQPAAPRVVLRRGADGALDLYRWWDLARRGKAPRRRTLKVHLLADDHETVVLTWVFRNVRPASLSYSPLNANDGSVVMETIELAFDSMEMA